MRLAELKEKVRCAFGSSMEHATPANVREFLDRVAQEHWADDQAERADRDLGTDFPIELPLEKPLSYEEILREFFSDMLSAPNEQALIHLWLLALDMAYAGLEEQAEQEIGALFPERNNGE